MTALLAAIAFVCSSLMPSSIQDILERHNRYQDSMVQAFETHLRSIVLQAQGNVITELQRKLALTDGAIDATAANSRALRGVNDLFMKAMRDAGYDRLVEAFTGEFRGTLPFLDEIIRKLGDDVGQQWDAAKFSKQESSLLASSQVSAATSIDQAVQAAAGTAMTRGLLSVGGLRFSSLVSTLTDNLETSIGRARTIADTSMTMFYRTASDRAFQTIEKDLPAQEIRYRYSGPDDKLTRPFCDHLMRADKSYTREEIGKMNNGQLPNVFITGGGWNCRHTWILDTEGVDQRRIVPVETLLTPQGIDIGRQVKIATGAIDSVHSVPASIGQVPIIGERIGAKRLGTTQFNPTRIALNADGPHPALTTVHEIGHVLDRVAIGDPDSFASTKDAILDGWRSAILQTELVGELEKMRDQARRLGIRKLEQHFEYLLEPHELFARSYSQFIAVASGSRALRNQLDAALASGRPANSVPELWSPSDFSAIRAQFEALIMKLGWNK